MHTQETYDVRLDWGARGLENLLQRCSATHPMIVVIVDVLSFSTCVDIAVGRGAAIIPCAWRDENQRAALAQRHNAIVAGPRSHLQPSLSPASLQQLQADTRLVLPSPNGSALTQAAIGYGATVVCGCLRNAAAIAATIAKAGQPCAIIAAGEQWPDGSLRPALEDHLGAGAIARALLEANLTASPEAEAAAAAIAAVPPRSLPDQLARCASGRELVARGFPEDVAIAGLLNASAAVPTMVRTRALEPAPNGHPADHIYTDRRLGDD